MCIYIYFWTIVVTGFSVDYALHMSTAFASPSLTAVAMAAESRIAIQDSPGSETDMNNNDEVLPSEIAAWRAAECIVELRGSILGAALTTCVAAASLIGCTIQIFVKMGMTLMACTLLSAIFALLVLPGFLLCFAQRDAQPNKSVRTPNPRHSSEGDVLEEQEEGPGTSAIDPSDIDMNTNANNDSTFINNAALRAELGLAPLNSINGATGASEPLSIAPNNGKEDASRAVHEAVHSTNPQNTERRNQSSNARAQVDLRSKPSLDRPLPREVCVWRGRHRDFSSRLDMI